MKTDEQIAQERETRLQHIKEKFYRDHVQQDGTERLIMKVAADAIPKPDARSEARAEGEGEPGSDRLVIEGYAAVFDIDSDGLWFIERVAPGAFRNSILTDDVVALMNHDKNLVLGRTSAGTLELLEDQTGLKYIIDVPDTNAGRDAHTSVKRRDIAGSSFSFRTIEDNWKYLDDGDTIIRTLIEVELFDVGPVTFPTYKATTSTARDMKSFIDEVEKESGQGDEPWQLSNARNIQQMEEAEL